MTAKVRLVTRRIDLSVEGDNVEQVEALIDALEERGLSPRAVIGVAATMPQTATSDAQTASGESVVGPRLDEWAGGGPGIAVETGSGTLASPEAAPIHAVTKRAGEMFVLRPKFPPTANGAERVEDAAMVLLGAYDAAGESGVTGSRLISSLRQTGYALGRVDKLLDDLRRNGQILVDGRRRGRRYMLSEAGREKSRALAGELAKLAGRPVEPSP